MKDPKTTTAHILYELIMYKDGVTERDFYYNGFRQRISELRRKHLVAIDSVPQEFTNKFGHKGVFSRYILRTKKNDALKIYNKINN